jgi:hypothetical protein
VIHPIPILAVNLGSLIFRYSERSVRLPHTCWCYDPISTEVADAFDVAPAPQRIEFVDRQDRTSYLRTYDRMDIALHTIPCNGRTMSLDAMWMGMPRVSLVGTKAFESSLRKMWRQWCQTPGST